MRKCAKFDFLINSDEFRVFSRPGGGDIEKMLERLPRLPTATMIERQNEVTNVQIRMYDFADKERLAGQLTEFKIFAMKVLPQLKALKKVLSNFRETKSQVISNSKVLQGLLDKYEDLNMNCYTEGVTEKLVLNNPDNKQLKDQMEHMIENQKNPFDEMYHWCKGEIYDIKAMIGACQRREEFERILKKTEVKKSNT